MWVLTEAFCWILVSKASIMWIPFKHIASGLGQVTLKAPEYELDEEHRRAALRVARAVNRVADRMPWKCKCLERAMATKYMLKRRRVVSTLYLGVQKSPEKTFLAHAWLKCGDVMVTGGGVASQFTVVSTFT